MVFRVDGIYGVRLVVTDYNCSAINGTAGLWQYRGDRYPLSEVIKSDR